MKNQKENEMCLQDLFLNSCVKKSIKVNIFLHNGVKLIDSKILDFDSFTILIESCRETKYSCMLIYKNNIGSITSEAKIDLNK